MKNLLYIPKNWPRKCVTMKNLAGSSNFLQNLNFQPKLTIFRNAISFRIAILFCQPSCHFSKLLPYPRCSGKFWVHFEICIICCISAFMKILKFFFRIAKILQTLLPKVVYRISSSAKHFQTVLFRSKKRLSVERFFIASKVAKAVLNANLWAQFIQRQKIATVFPASEASSISKLFRGSVIFLRVATD